MKIPIVADFNKDTAKAYGVLLPGGEPLRALFIISPTGILRQITVNDLPVGRNVDEIIRLVKAFQYTDTHGEVCPANWQPGDLTMIAEPTGSKEYFSAVNSATQDASAAVGAITEVTDAAEFATVTSAGVTVVDFWAPWYLLLFLFYYSYFISIYLNFIYNLFLLFYYLFLFYFYFIFYLPFPKVQELQEGVASH